MFQLGTSKYHFESESPIISWKLKLKFHTRIKVLQEKVRGHPELNQGPLDLQSNAQSLSYIPIGHWNFKAFWNSNNLNPLKYGKINRSNESNGGGVHIMVWNGSWKRTKAKIIFKIVFLSFNSIKNFKNFTKPCQSHRNNQTELPLN